MLDLAAYLERIGLRGELSPAELHRAHVAAIPFENLDPRNGLRVSLDPAELEAKLVARRRGGYCFEQNLLFASALEDLGATVEPMLARVRLGRPAQAQKPLTHLLLKVTHEGQVWHADVGFGNGTLLEPIPFGPGGPYEQAGWRFQVVTEGDEFVLQTELDGEWRDVYSFLPRAVAPIDIELSNWFTSTHPESAFVNRLLVARQDSDGTRVLLSDFSGELSLSVRTPSSQLDTPVSEGELAELLRERFGLDNPSAIAQR